MAEEFDEKVLVRCEPALAGATGEYRHRIHEDRGILMVWDAGERSTVTFALTRGDEEFNFFAEPVQVDGWDGEEVRDEEASITRARLYIEGCFPPSEEPVQ